MKEETYEIKCIICSEIEHLCMVAHRSHGRVVGWVFACRDCKGFVCGKELVFSEPDQNPDQQK